MREWKTISWEECPCCGNSVQVLTDCDEPDHVCDGDPAQCCNSECDCSGTCIVDDLAEPPRGYVSWEDFEDETIDTGDMT